MRIVLVLAFVAVAVRPAPTEACSLVGNEDHVLDPAEQAVDATPPSPPAQLEPFVNRGEPEESGCGPVSSCGSFGSVMLHATGASDDRTPAEQLGHRVELVAGDWRGEIPQVAVRGDSIVLYDFHDEGEGDFDATFAVRAVDLAGNESEPVMIRVTDQGSGSCRIAARRGRDASPWLVLVALAVPGIVGARRRARA